MKRKIHANAWILWGFTVFMRLAEVAGDNRGKLDVKQEVHHVAVFNDVVFTF